MYPALCPIISDMALKIAIIEDEDMLCEMYKMKFENEGFKVYLARNGQEGLELAEKVMPDMILLDLMMPVMSGEEMLKAMRATEWGKSLPVILLTNIGDDAVMEKIKRYNILEYVVKANYSPSQVVGFVKQFTTA